MSDNYDDIIDLDRPSYDDLPPMSVSDRAAQFSPFAAVVGYGDAVEETARFTDMRIELQEDAVYELNQKLEQIRSNSLKSDKVRITYFVPDKYKKGGKYAQYEGTVRKIDEYSDELILDDGHRIRIAEITDIIVL